MKRTWTFAILAFLVIGSAAIAILPGLWAAGKPSRDVFVRATFRDAVADDGRLLDKVRSDGQGPYINSNFINCTITGAGELHINIDANSGRRCVFIFDDLIAPRTGACPEAPPDTACDPFDAIPDEPADFAFFTTHNSTIYETPQVNLLTMSDGQSAEVNCWIGFNTDSRSGTFYAKWDRNYNPDDPTRKGGYVLVTATDANKDGQVDRWVFSTIPGTDDSANLHRVWQAQKNKFGYCDYGNFKMPFELVLERL